jgi:hypothetical protein
MAQKFSELIYKSAEATVGIGSGDADRLLGVRPDGTAVVVGIDGDNTPLTLGDVVDDDVSRGGFHRKVYSAYKTDDKYIPYSDKFYEWDLGNSYLESDKSYMVYTCEAVDKLLEGFSPSSDNPSTPVTTDSSKWEASGSAAIKPKSNKSITVPSVAISGSSMSIGGSGHTLKYENSGFVFSDKCTATSFYESSDAALKENVKGVSEDTIRKAADVRLVEFDWKNGDGHSYGVIAQEVKKLMPELVSGEESDTLKVNYIALLCAKVAYLESQVTELKSLIGNGSNKNIG